METRKRQPLVANPSFLDKCLKQVTAREPRETSTLGRNQKKKEDAWKRPNFPKGEIENKRRKNARALKKELHAEAGTSEEMTLYDKLAANVLSSIRGKREYSYHQAEWIARVGTTPSAGGSRSPLSGIISQVSDKQLCVRCVPVRP